MKVGLGLVIGLLVTSLHAADDACRHHLRNLGDLISLYCELTDALAKAPLLTIDGSFHRKRLDVKLNEPVRKAISALHACVCEALPACPPLVWRFQECKHDVINAVPFLCQVYQNIEQQDVSVEEKQKACGCFFAQLAEGWEENSSVETVTVGHSPIKRNYKQFSKMCSIAAYQLLESMVRLFLPAGCGAAVTRSQAGVVSIRVEGRQKKAVDTLRSLFALPTPLEPALPLERAGYDSDSTSVD